MTKFEELISLCKASVTLNINEHLDSYQNVEEYLDNQQLYVDELSNEIRQEMIRIQKIVNLQFYPDTPIGSYTIWHYDVEKAIDEALEILKNR